MHESQEDSQEAIPEGPAGAAQQVQAEAASKSTPPPPARDSVVSLREITKDTVLDICELKTTTAQESFVAPNTISFAQALFEQEHAWYRAIYADETPVGFIMLYDDPKNEKGALYYLWRFMIDTRYQKMGFGHKALDLLVEHVKSRPEATFLTLSYVDGEGGPADFYHRYGFVDTGEIEDGELVSKLSLMRG